jgi:membrane associated rhomboid family serine protease
MGRRYTRDVPIWQLMHRVVPSGDEPRQRRYNHWVSDEPTQRDPEQLFANGGGGWATAVLVALNLAVAVAGVVTGTPWVVVESGQAIAAGAVEPVRVWHGEVWRLLSACFVHLGIWHLGLNLWTLWVVGRALERMIGPARLVLVYLTAGLGGFALSLAIEPGITAGASGAIFGVTGGLFALAVLVRQAFLGRYLWTVLMPFIVATLAMGWLLPFVNNVAHVGGFVFGALLTFGLQGGDRSFVFADEETAQRAGPFAIPLLERITAPIVLVLSLVGLLALSSYAVRPVLSPSYQVIMATSAINDGQEVRARLHLEQAKQLGPQDGLTLVGMGALQHSIGAPEAGRALVQAGLTVLDDDRVTAMRAAERGLLLHATTDTNHSRDDTTSAALCDAVVDENIHKAATVRNNCAWLWATTEVIARRDPPRAVHQAWLAVKDTEHSPTVVHTYARALAADGQVEEALRWLEVLAVDGADHELARAGVSLSAERTVIAAMHPRLAAGTE